MKKIISVLLLAILALTLCAPLTACSDAPKHVHTSDTYIIGEDAHWKVCDTCGEVFARSKHSYTDGVCHTCGYYVMCTDGLAYDVLNVNEDFYYCVSGIGTATDTHIYIPYFHNSLPVIYINESAFKDCTEITGLTIPDSVTDMGFYAFQNCTNLTEVDTGNGLKSITFSVFDGCTALSDLHIGNGVTGLGEWAFRNCTSLTQIYLPDSLIDLNGGAFDGCTNLVYNECENGIYLGSRNNPYMALMKLKDRSVSSMTVQNGARFINGEVFSDCTNITSLDIPEGVLSIARSTFANCTALEHIGLPSTLESIGSTSFSGCISLTEITIDANIKSIGLFAFQGCTGLTRAFFEVTDGWYRKLSLQETAVSTDIEDDLSDAAIAANCLTTYYASYFIMHD